MTDFLSSIKSGIQSAVTREENFLEIHDLFITLKEQIDNFSEGKINVELVSLGGGPIGSAILSPKNYFNDKSQLYRDKKLNVSSYDKSSTYTLTEIHFDRDNGYPCTILINGDEFTSMNKESLEDNIKMLLASSRTGSVLYSLLKKAP